MPLFGTLDTMPLQDLLQWIASGARTGTLKVEHERVAKSVLMRDGRICGCTSNDPPEKLGHFLLSRGRVTEQQLRCALTEQETSRKYLGEAFVGMGVLTQEELASHLEAQAEETIFSLFDWDDAVFRFSEDLAEQPRAFQVDLDITDVVSRGVERAAEVRQIREVFPDCGVIVRKSSLRLPTEALSNTMAQTLYDAIDGERTLAQLLLHVHGCEYLVTRFLFALHGGGFIEVVSPRPGHPDSDATVEPPVDPAEPDLAASLDSILGSGDDASARPAPGREISPVAVATPEPDPVAAIAIAEAPRAASTSTVAAGSQPAPAEAPECDEMDLPDLPIDPHNADPDVSDDAELLDIPDMFVESSDVEALEDSTAYQMRRSLALARKQMNDGKYEEALTAIGALYDKYPDDDSLRRLLAEAEAAFIDRAYRHYVPAAKILSLKRPIESLAAETLSPTEFFLISRIDGTWDVKSIVQISPLREIDVLLTLKRLRENGVIEFSDAEIH